MHHSKWYYNTCKGHKHSNREEIEMVKTGMIVRYKKEWCSPGEREYLHVVMENRLNPVTGKMSRWLIKTINMKNMVLQPTSVVEEDMIEPTGFDVENYTA